MPELEDTPYNPRHAAPCTRKPGIRFFRFFSKTNPLLKDGRVLKTMVRGQPRNMAVTRPPVFVGIANERFLRLKQSSIILWRLVCLGYELI